MSNKKYDDDPCLFTKSEAIWINRIAGEALIYGDDWEHKDKRTATGKLLFEAASSIEVNDRTLSIITPNNIIDLNS